MGSEGVGSFLQGVVKGLFNDLPGLLIEESSISNNNALSDPSQVVDSKKVEPLGEKPEGTDSDAIRVFQEVKGGLIRVIEGVKDGLSHAFGEDKIDLDNSNKTVELKEENPILVDSSADNKAIDLDNATGGVQLNEQNLVLVNFNDENNKKTADNSTGELKVKFEKVVFPKSSEQTNLTETKKQIKTPKPDTLFVFTRRNPKRSASNSQKDLNINRLTSISNRGRKSFKEKNIKESDPKLLNGLVKSPKLATKKRNSFNRRDKNSIWGKMDNVEQALEESREFYNLKKIRDEIEKKKLRDEIEKKKLSIETVQRKMRDEIGKKNLRDEIEKKMLSNEAVQRKLRALIKERKDNKEKIAPNLERDLDSTLTHEGSSHEATQRVVNSGDLLYPGSSPDSVVYNPISSAANPVAGQNGSAVKNKEEKMISDTLKTTGVASPVAGRDGSGVKNTGKDGVASPVAGRNGSGAKKKEKDLNNNEPWFYKNIPKDKKKEANVNGGYNGVTIAFSPWTGPYGFPPPMPFRSVPMAAKPVPAKSSDDNPVPAQDYLAPAPLRSVPMPEKSSDGNPVPAPPYYAPMPLRYAPAKSSDDKPVPAASYLAPKPIRSVPMAAKSPDANPSYLAPTPLRYAPMSEKSKDDKPVPAASYFAPTPLRSVPMSPKSSDSNPVPAPAYLAPTPPNRVRTPANPVPTAPAYRMPAYPVPTQFYANPSAQVKSPHAPAPAYAVPAPANPVPAKPRCAWVQCDECDKWRSIPAELADIIDETDCRWTCKENQDKRFNNCSIPQEKSNSEINAELDISDVSGDEGPTGQRYKSKDTNHANPFMQEPKPAFKALHPAYYVPLKTNLFLQRNRKTQTIDEVMVCNCKAPQNGGLGCKSTCLNRMLSIECVNGMCPLGELCSNQRFQRQDYAKLMWFRSGKKGFGLQVQEDVKAGRFLIEYVGEVLDMATYEARQKEYAARGQKHFYFMTLNGGEVIDACAKGNLGRFINHSCDPNCRTEKWIVNGEVCIGLFAIRDINMGEELTFDYNYVRVVGAAAKKCFCGSKICRGYLGGDPSNNEIIVQADSDDEEEYFQPVISQPVITQPISISTNQPVITQPISISTNQPVITQPISISTNQPVITQPISISTNQPIITQPISISTNQPIITQPVMTEPDSISTYKLVSNTSLKKYLVESNYFQEIGKSTEELTGLKNDEAVVVPVKPEREVEPVKAVSEPVKTQQVDAIVQDLRVNGKMNKDDSSQSENCPGNKEVERMNRDKNLTVMRDASKSENCSVNRAERMDRDSNLSILGDKSKSENCSVVKGSDRMDKDNLSILLDKPKSKTCSVSKGTERMDKDTNLFILIGTSKSENCSVNREVSIRSDNKDASTSTHICSGNRDVSTNPVHICSENKQDVFTPILPETPLKDEKEKPRAKTAENVKKDLKRINGSDIDKKDLKPESKPKRARLVRNSEKLFKEKSEVKERPVKRDSALYKEEKKSSRNTDEDDDFFEEVEDRLNKLLDADGGISKRKDATKGYLKLLIVTAAAGDTGTSQRLRDLIMILDAILKTKSRTVLSDIMKKNGLHMLHTILKQNRDNFNRIPIIRKLLKVLDFLADKGILTVEQMNVGPACFGAESFRESIFKLTKHNSKMVYQGAREFFNKWMPKRMHYKNEPSFNPLKRKSPNPNFPSQNPNFPSSNPNFPSQNPNFPSPNPNFSENPNFSQNPNFPKKLCTRDTQEEDAPPGFGIPKGKTVISEPGQAQIQTGQLQLPTGQVQDRYRSGTSLSYGMPAVIAQKLSTYVQSNTGVFWGTAPSVPFKPFPPVPTSPRIIRNFPEDRKGRRWEPYESRNSNPGFGRNRNSRWDKEKWELDNNYDNYYNEDNNNKQRGNNRGPKWPREIRW